MKKSEREPLLRRKKEDLVTLILRFKEMNDKQRDQIEELEDINSALTEEKVNIEGRISDLERRSVERDKTLLEEVATSVNMHRVLSEQINILTNELNVLTRMKKSLDEALGIEREKNLTFQRDYLQLQQKVELLRGIIIEVMGG